MKSGNSGWLLESEICNQRDSSSRVTFYLKCPSGPSLVFSCQVIAHYVTMGQLTLQSLSQHVKY
jgi:hypothetical protein